MMLCFPGLLATFTDGTAIRQGFPSPPGWSAQDRSGLDWLPDAESEAALSRELKSGRVDAAHSAAALLASTGSERKLYLVPRVQGDGQWRIGRSDDCEITLDDLTVSTHHATLSWLEGSWHIADEKSRNGLILNGSVCEEAMIAAGDRFRLGRVDLLFRPLADSD